MNNIFSIYWFQSNKSCVVHSGNTNTVAHLGNSHGVRSELLHRSVAAPRLDDGTSSYDNPGNSFIPWFLKGEIKGAVWIFQNRRAVELYVKTLTCWRERVLCLYSVTKIWWKNQLCYFIPRAKTNLSYAPFPLHLVSSALFSFES